MIDTFKLSDISSSMLQYIYFVRCAFREIWRSSAFRISAGLGTFLFQSYYLLCVQYQHLFAIFSSTLGVNNTIFFFGYLPTYFILLFQISAVAFALFAFARMDRSQELLSRPCRNSDILFGCALGATILLFAVVFVNVALILAGASLVSTFDAVNANVPAVVPAFNFLLFDMFPTLFFWSSFSLLVVVVVRSTIVAFALTSIAATSLWLLTVYLPIDWTVVFSSYSYSSMVVSDMATRWSESAIVINRVTVLFAAFGSYFLAAYLWRRRVHELKREVWSGVVALVATACLFGSQVLNIQASEDERGAWVQAHGEFSPHEVADLECIRGSIEIDPGNHLVIDLDLILNTPTDFDSSELIFSFNPSMKIERLTLNGAPAVFTFGHGILAVQYDRALVSVATDNVLSIRASGIPDVNFGYLEPAIDYLHSPGMSVQTRKLFGTHNSIFNDQFVALMPGSRWYPTPGPLSVDKHVEALTRAPDFFDVDLTVTINEDGWNAAGPGSKSGNAEVESTFTFQTHNAVPQIAILASKFESRVASIGDMTFELLIHESHVDGIQPLNSLEEDFMKHLAERLDALKELGIQFKNPRITFVETPNYLRTVSGYGMSFVYSMPGVVLVKESSIPLWNMEKTLKRRQELLDEYGELELSLFSDAYFYNLRNISGGNILEALAAQLHPYSYRQFASGNVSLNYLRRLLTSESIFQNTYRFRYLDAEMVASFASRTVANPITVLDGLLGTYKTRQPLYLDFRTREYLDGAIDSSDSQSIVLSEIDLFEDNFKNRKILLQRTWHIHRALREIYGEQQLNRLISPLHESGDLAAEVDSIDYIYRTADRLELNLSPFVREWWTTDESPSFLVSQVQSNLVSVEDSDLNYQVSFDIRNDSNTHGVVQFYSATENSSGTVAGKAIEMGPQISNRVNLYSAKPITRYLVDTFHSKNEWVIQLVSSSDDIYTVGQIRPLIEPSFWLPTQDEYIVVDNLDPGVELLNHSPDRLEFPRTKTAGINFLPSLPRITREGIDYFGSFPSRIPGDIWRFIEMGACYGKYRRSMLMSHAARAPTLRFKTKLPSSGKWVLDYHFPYARTLWDQYGRYYYILRDDATEYSVSLNAKGLRGWVRLGSFDLVGPEVHLDFVSVEPTDALRIADAIRWKRSDE